jgi:nitronate monooxygenase
MFNFAHLKTPIIQAPMAGGINTPGLAAAVASAGGVGSFGFAYSSAKKIADDLVATKALTAGPINANFFVFSEVAAPDHEAQLAAVRALERLPLHGDFKIDIPQAPFFPDLNEQLAPVWEHCPAMISFHFGIPPKSVIDRARALGICVGITATNIEEAQAIERAGANFIVAQGIEAGGHRGIFNPLAPDEQLSALSLTKQLAARCALPIVTAGAIMDGQAIAAALDAGASAVQMGTAFLCCDEAGTSAAHKNFLLREHSRGTALTRSFSGRLARGIQNEFMEHMDGAPTLPFPIQNTLTASLRQWANKTNNGEYQSLWAGTEYPKVRAHSAQTLMATLDSEYRRLRGIFVGTGAQ